MMGSAMAVGYGATNTANGGNNKFLSYGRQAAISQVWLRAIGYSNFNAVLKYARTDTLEHGEREAQWKAR